MRFYLLAYFPLRNEKSYTPIKTSTLDLQERERSEFLLTVLYLDYEDLYCYCNWVCFHSDDTLLAIVLDGCELHLVTDSVSGLRACHAREIRAKVSFKQVSR